QPQSPPPSPLPLHTRLLATPPQPQPNCPLFSLLPAEVRSDIFSLALADYPDPSPDRHYQAETCYTRPAYFAPRRTDWQLLATCRLAYAEAWHLPFVLREQTHWLTSQDRAPPEYRVGRGDGRGGVPGSTQREMLERRLAQVARSLGGEEEEEEGDGFEIQGLRVFAQMYKLEGGHLAALLGTPGLRPRRVTLTVRHADWWFWESDERLRVEGQQWLEGVCGQLRASVREVCIELESLERKKDQVDEIARQMRERWFFKRGDGEGLFADVSGRADEVTRWSGTSTWNGRRWVRDETAEGRLDYYVVAVWFRPLHVVQRRGGSVSEEARRACEADEYKADRLRLTVPIEMKRTPPGGSVVAVMPNSGRIEGGNYAVDYDPDL
ncbi:Alanine--tRNA ligase, partial [Coniochaeta hoffmannii]